MTGAVPGPPTRDLTYDANGNLVRMVVTSATGLTSSTVSYEWDAWNRLKAVETVGLHRSEFTYDGLGRRVKIVEKNPSGTVLETRWFVWEGLSIAEERADAGGAPGAVVKRFFGQGEERISAGAATSYFYSRDHLGSVREVTDAAGNLAARYEYDPYGNVTRTAGTQSFDFLYTGRFYHGLSGMYLAPYRAYDPRLGRWISAEPLEKDGPNLYHYVRNTPATSVDPDGLFTVGIFQPVLNWWYGVDSISSHTEQTASTVADYYTMQNSYSKQIGCTLYQVDTTIASRTVTNIRREINYTIVGMSVGPIFKITREIAATARIIAEGRRIRDVERLVQTYGGCKRGWKKMSSRVMEDEFGRRIEWHWYEHHGIGRVEGKPVIK